MVWNGRQHYCMSTFLHFVIKSKCTTKWLKNFDLHWQVWKHEWKRVQGRNRRAEFRKEKEWKNLMLTSLTNKLGNGRVHAMLSCTHTYTYTYTHACMWAYTHTIVSLLLLLAQWERRYIWSLLDPLCYKIHVRNTHIHAHTHHHHHESSPWFNHTYFYFSWQNSLSHL